MTDTILETPAQERHVFEADVSRLLYMMVHSVYSDKDVFLRELISNAADACEKLRYEAISHPGLASDASPRILVTLDEENDLIAIEDNGIGMSRAEMIEALGTIARSGTRAFMERLEANKTGEGAELIGQFGVGFYSAFMVADRVDVVSRRAGSDEAWLWSSDGKGTYSIRNVAVKEAPARGTRVILNLMKDAKTYATKWAVERIIREQSGHVPVAIEISSKPDETPTEISNGTALWAKSKSEVTEAEYADFYRGVSGQYDEPALTVHFRAEGRHEYSVLAFIPGSPPFDLFDTEPKGRIKLYVRRVFITNSAELLPHYLRFVRGVIDTTDLPLNVSREMIQQSPILAAIRKSVTNRVLAAMEALAASDSEAFSRLWSHFGSVIKEGLYDDFERREQLLTLARFRSTVSGEGLRSLKDYVGDMKVGQDAIYFITGGNLDQMKASPQLEGFRARGIEVLLLSDAVDSFWAPQAPAFDGKPLKSITQGIADLDKVGIVEGGENASEISEDVKSFIAFARQTLSDEVTDVRVSTRLTESASCLVASDQALDRQMERLLHGAGRLQTTDRPILELNPANDLVKAASTLADEEFRVDAAWMLFDEARILDGDRPTHPRQFADRLSRLFKRALKD